MYVFKEPYSREKLRVLLSIDYPNSPDVQKREEAARKKGSDIIMFEMQGEQGLKGSVRKHLREIGLVLKEAEADETPEWEVEEFYELTHPGED
jgi:hypothetical protein